MGLDIAIASKNSAKASQYWLKSLSGDIDFVSLASTRLPDQNSKDFQIHNFKVPSALSEILLKIVNSDHTLLYIFLLTVYKILLYKHCSGKDIITASPVFRTDSKVNNEFLPYRVILSDTDTFKTIITKVKEAVLSAARYQFYPLEKIFALIDQTSSTDFLKNIVSLEQLHGSLYDEKHSVLASCEMALSFQIESEIIVGNIAYNTRRFSLAEVKKRSQEFLLILQQVVQNFDIPLDEIEIISESERKLVLDSFNQPVENVPPGFLHREFENIVCTRPHDIAIVHDTDKITYLELNKKANQLAHLLRNMGHSGNKPVGLLFDKSIDMVIAILAILKAGGAYVPIDPASPKKRIEFICNDADFDLIVLQQKYGKLIPDKIKPVNVDMIHPELKADNIAEDVRDESIANIIYTSGSTGHPKGVKVTHKGLLNFILWRINEYRFCSKDVTLQLLSVAFDGFGTNLYSSLLSGGILVLPDDQQLGNYAYLQDLVTKNRITNTSLVPTMFKAILQNTSPEIWKSLRFVVFGGEKADPDLLTLCKKINEKLLLINEYGPTENSITSTIYKDLKPQECHIIGKPIPNINVFITLQDGCLAPIDTPGEICVSGVGLAQGYLNRPELDQESFFLDRFGNRVYKTGDIGRWNKDGNIEYLGRLDDQVKIRGHRIEIKEIETCLLNQFDIDRCLVRLFVKETPVLVAYYTSRDEFETNELRESLKSFLPDYMIPAFFIRLAAFPLTINGKIDQKRLPDPSHSQKSYVAPSTKTEKQLAKIWEQTLKVSDVSSNDNFFECGGHSLQAFSMLSRVNQAFGIQISFNMFSDAPQLSMLARLIEKSKKYNPIPKAPEKEIFPLSPAQQRIFTLYQLEPSGVHYNMPVCYCIEGSLDNDECSDAVQALVNRHDMLRTYFEFDGVKPVQKILKNLKVDVARIKIDVSEKENFERDFIQPFKIDNAPLFRVTLLEIENSEKRYLFMDFHHLVADGLSIKILSQEMFQLLQGKPLDSEPARYVDYVIWQTEQDLSEHESYWQKRFSDPIPVFEIPPQYPRPSLQSFEGDHIRISIDEDLETKIKRFAQKHKLSLFRFFFSAFFLFLSKFTDQEKVIVGTPVLSRTHPDVSNTVGMFVNTLAIEMEIFQDETFTDYLDRFQEQLSSDINHQDYPFEMLVNLLELDRQLDRNPLFNIMFDYQRIDDFLTDEIFEKFKIRPELLNMNISKFDLSLTVIEDKKFEFFFEYASELYGKPFIERLAKNFTYFIEHILTDSLEKLAHIPFIHPDEKRALLDRNPQPPEEPIKTLVELFRNQVKRDPSHTALIYNGNKMSYDELDCQSDNVAEFLKIQNISTEDIIALSMTRSMDMIIGMLGILKAGAAFLPLDPNTPLKRNEFYLEKSKAKLILGNCERFSSLENLSIKEYLIQDIDLLNKRASPKSINSKPDSLAYVIFTSGSTGRPKGVMVEHRNIVSYLNAYNKEFGIKPEDRILQTSSFTFDASLEEIFGALCHGATLVLPTQSEIKSITKLVNLVNTHKITIFTGTPALISEFEKLEPLHSVRLFICGADVLRLDHIARLLSYADVYNVYGPTEATISCTYKKIDDHSRAIIPIGRPIQNSSIYILDDNKNLASLGMPGEIYIGGQGVARGYLDESDLTVQHFIKSELNSSPLYKTGDLGRWLPEGEIEFLGRKDEQCKIRGFRIELGEIETQLCGFEGINNAAVKVFNERKKDAYLCAYYSGENFSDIELQDYLAQYFPSYMIPAAFVHVDALPVNKNGKIDKNKLIEPDKEKNEKLYIAPRNEIETKLCEIWQDILQREQIGIDDNFFALGGHSLKAIQMGFKVDQALKVEISIAEILHHLTIRKLANLVEKSNSPSDLKTLGKKGSYRLSSSQTRIYAVDNIEKNSIRYHIPLAYKLFGDIDIHRLERALTLLVQRHAILRTCFHLENHIPVQKVHDNIAIEIHPEKRESLDIQNEISAFIKPFKLDSAPLFRLKLFYETSSNHYYLFLDFHHILVDGVSIDIFERELELLYQGASLPPLNIQYYDYAEWEHEFLHSKMLKKQEDFWLETLSGDIPKLDLPTDFIRPQIQSSEGAKYDIELDHELVKRVHRYARNQNTSIFNVFLAVLNILLYKYTGQNEFIVGVPFANRKRKEFQNLIGVMINTLALRNKVVPGQNCNKFVSDIQRNMERAFENQDYPFEKLVEKLELDRDTSHNPLFDIVFSAFELPNSIDKRAESSLWKEHLDFQMPLAKFDITLYALYNQKKILLGWEYCTKLFKEETIQLLAKYFIHVLKTLIDQPNQPIKDVEIISDIEKAQIHNVFNDTNGPYPFDKNCIQLFQEQAEQNADRYAVISDARKLLYAELDHYSNLLAAQLCSLGENLNIVGLYIEKSAEMIIGMLAILKAGAAYLPIDPEYPQERIEYMLRDCDCNIVLAQRSLFNQLPKDIRAIDIEECMVDHDKELSLGMNYNSESLAYIMYTSGSTGKPKGVMIDHRNIVRLVKNIDYVKFNKDTRLLQTGAPVFDATTIEVWGPLLNGGQLVLVDKTDILDVKELKVRIRTYNINTMWLTSALFNIIIDQDPDSLVGLEWLLVGGDVVSPKHVLKAKKASPNLQIINGYGPTENCVFSTTFLITEPIRNPLPIGKPINNSRAYIVDEFDHLQPIAVPGELLVGGDGVGRGYLNQPELTAEKFHKDPFLPGHRVYRTGDIAKWDRFGNIEFLGRKDNQIKLHGFRIECGEIEKAIIENTQIDQCLVMVQELSDDKILCCYYVCTQELDSVQIRTFLAQVLPDYMIPVSFMHVKEFPLTVNGKVNREALPNPTLYKNENKADELPKNNIQKELQNIWQDILHQETVSINDNFFQLGGDSIKAIQVVSKLREKGFQASVADIFQHGTIKELSDVVDFCSESLIPHYLPENNLLLPIQRWFFEQNFKYPHYFNQSIILSAKSIDYHSAKKALSALINHHDSLRMVLSLDKKSMTFQDSLDPDLKVIDKKEQPKSCSFERELNDLQADIDLFHGPLFKAAIIFCKDKDYFFLTIHHLVVDSTSWSILISDFANLYENYKANNPIQLATKTHSYGQWTKALLSEQFLKQKPYWVNVCTGPFVKLPLTNASDKNKEPLTKKIIFDQQKTAEILCSIHSAFGTNVQQILLTALGMTLFTMIGKGNILISLEGHGREELNMDLDVSRTVGWFTALYPVNIHLKDRNMEKWIIFIKDMILKIPQKGIGYGVLRYSEKMECEDRNILSVEPEISFNYLGEALPNSKVGEFEISQLDPGKQIHEKNRMPAKIEVSGVVHDSKLYMHFSSFKDQIESTFFDRFVSCYQKYLRALAEFCLNRKERTFTPGDFDKDDLSLEDLNEIMEEYN
ncbi:amino acid adenylation domain-containing protein [candidate division KSB1 bacterium]|nr:amino acid adenylation domain-containing protein [candidate division KSB1 bacterium]